MSKNPVSPTIIVLSVFSFVFAAGLFGLLGPVLRSLGKELARVDAYVQQPVIAEASAAQKLLALQDQAAQAAALMPEENDLYDLSIQIEALAAKEGVRITGLALSPSTASGAPPTTSDGATAQNGSSLPSGAETSVVGVSIVGDYAASQRFTIGLTQLSRFIQIQDLTVTAIQGGSGEGESVTPTGQVNTQINAFVFNIPYGS